MRPTADTWQVPNDDAGITALVAQRCAAAPTLVVLEATGGYKGPLTAVLAATGLPIVLTACMHKLLTIMNAMVRELTPWQPQEVAIA